MVDFHNDTDLVLHGQSDRVSDAVQIHVAHKENRRHREQRVPVDIFGRQCRGVHRQDGQRPDAAETIDVRRERAVHGDKHRRDGYDFKLHIVGHVYNVITTQPAEFLNSSSNRSSEA